MYIKTFKRRPGRLLYILSTFNLRHVSIAASINKVKQISCNFEVGNMELNKDHFPKLFCSIVLRIPKPIKPR